ncbi:MAG TPA: PIG-L family deacetylase [Polyangiales bacterium]
MQRTFTHPLVKLVVSLAIGLALTATLMPHKTQASPAAPPTQPDAARLGRALDKLQVVGSVLYIAAHPDDENTRLLAYLANDKLWRAGYLSITRGDGGQNLIGSEQGPLLGLIRTQELLAARRLDGAEQLFTRARDFGYSKHAEEALAIWGHDDTLADVVLAIRRFQPDVIITRFSPNSQQTHGHHTASAQLAVEAFEKAADPSYHPEQVQRHGSWRARRVVWNDSLFPGSPARDFSSFVKLDVGGYSPARGLSWGELAADSRSMHKSQGFGAARQRGPQLDYFKVLAGEPITSSPLDGVVSDWSRVAGSGKLVDALRRARAAFRSSAPEQAIPALLEARDALDALNDNPWKSVKRAEIDAAVLACAGLFTEVVAAVPSVTQGSTLPITISALARRPVAITLRSVSLPGKLLALDRVLAEHVPCDVSETLPVATDAALANPYWLELPAEAGRYPVRDEAMIGLPEGPAPLEAELTFSIAGHDLHVPRAVAYKWTDPVAGERYRSVEVLPAVTIELDTRVLLFTQSKARELRVRVRSLAGAKGGVRLEAPEGFHVTPAEARFELPSAGEVELAFQVSPPVQARDAVLRAVATVDGDARRYDRSLRRIEHTHIPVQTVLPIAEARVVRTKLSHSHRKVGYLPGAGDEIPAALRQLGYQVVDLDVAALAPSNLKGLDVVVSGVRAWNVEPKLAGKHGVLMDWVARGGTLLVQYNTNNRIGPAPPELGPFPFAIGQGRVTDETAPLTLDKDPILTRPNLITSADFEGWVQERGLYFAETWDARYRAPLGVSDPGEKPLRGALLVAKHGKGAFIYTGLALFRQLPAGVPGAYRLFANLIEYGPAR